MSEKKTKTKIQIELEARLKALQIFQALVFEAIQKVSSQLNKLENKNNKN